MGAEAIMDLSSSGDNVPVPLWQEIMTFSLNFRKKRKLKSED